MTTLRKIILIIGIIPMLYICLLVFVLGLGLPFVVYILLFNKFPDDWLTLELLMVPWGCFYLFSVKYIIEYKINPIIGPRDVYNEY